MGPPLNKVSANIFGGAKTTPEVNDTHCNRPPVSKGFPANHYMTICRIPLISLIARVYILFPDGSADIGTPVFVQIPTFFSVGCPCTQDFVS